MQPTETQIKAAELAISGQVSFNPMTAHFTIAGVSVDGADFYRCWECGGNRCAHSLAAQAIDSAFDKARKARQERVLDEYLLTLQWAQDDVDNGFWYNMYQIEIKGAEYIKKTSRGMQMPIPQKHSSTYQAQRLRELGGSVAGLTYPEAKAEILRLEWSIWE